MSLANVGKPTKPPGKPTPPKRYAKGLTVAQKSTKDMSITVTRLVRPPVVVAPPSAGDRVKVHPSNTTPIYADNKLYAAWTSTGGDWFDATGTFNGSNSYVTDLITDTTPKTYNVSAIDGDIIIRGVQILAVSLDGVPQSQAFWCIGAGASLLPSGSGAPVFVINDNRATTITVTPYAGGTLYIDKVAGPLVMDYPTYIGAVNTPSVWELELTDDAAIVAAAARPTVGQPSYAGRIDLPLAYDYSFSVDPNNGMQYMRSAVTVAGGGLRDISWRLPYGVELETVYTRYCLYLEDDIADGMVELGVKHNAGASNETMGSGINGDFLIVYRMEHGAKSPQRNRGIYALVDYLYDAESGHVGVPVSKYLNAHLRAGRWYSIETAVRLNTGVGVHDGYGEVWVNGHSVWSTNTAYYRDEMSTRLTNYYANIYHGGLTPVVASIHYRMAKLAVSTSYIGIPHELASVASNYPAWRQALTVKDVWGVATNETLNGTVANTGGLENVQIQSWCGNAVDNGNVYFAIGGGHNGGFVNSTWKLDLNQESPVFTKLHGGSNPNDYLADQAYYAANYPSSGAEPLGQQLPGTRHTYYHPKYVSLAGTNYIVNFGHTSFTMDTTNPDTNIDAFNLTTNTWVPKGTLMATISGRQFETGCPVAQDPTTQDVYVFSFTYLWKWTKATNTWSNAHPPSGMSITTRGPMLVDSFRNRLVTWPDSGNRTRTTVTLSFMDLATNVATTLVTSGWPTWQSLPYNNSWDAENWAFVYDPINDRYLVGAEWFDLAGHRADLFAIHPTTGVVTQLNQLPTSYNTNFPFWNYSNGILSRIEYHANLRGISWLPSYAHATYFMPLVDG